MTLRLLFISSTTEGGSGRSQRELALQLAQLGHEVHVLADDARSARITRWAYEQLSDLSVRNLGVLNGVTARLVTVPGRKPRSARIEGLSHSLTPVPENALSSRIAAFQPDVVVASSVARWSWRRVRSTCSSSGVPVLLYLREEESLGHLDAAEAPDGLIANAASLAKAAERAGYSCEFVPSVIDTAVTKTDSSRLVALAINPIPSRGVDIVLEVARRLPAVAFVFQESWPLPRAQFEALTAQLAGLPNVTLRRAEQPGPALYQDARVLLVPYRVDNRPRVIAEAQANGIPVVVGDTPALTEAIGLGGAVAPLSDIGRWCEVIERLWIDEEWYESLVDAAWEHSRRPDIDPAHVALDFLDIVRAIADRYPERA